MRIVTTKKGFEIVYPRSAEDVEALLLELIGRDSINCYDFIDVIISGGAVTISNFDKSIIKSEWLSVLDSDLDECVDVCSISEWLWGA